MQRCLCLFLKYPTPGNVKTRLAADIGHETAAVVFSRMVCEVIRQVKQANPDVLAIFYDPPEKEAAVREWLGPWVKDFPGDLQFHAQCSGDLGDRLEQAPRTLLSENSERSVLIIGTDCIELEPAILQQAWRGLEENPQKNIVIGPVFDGGYYLIGTAHDCPILFRDIPWSQPTTFATTVEKIKANGLDHLCLPKKTDIDTIKEYQPFVSQLETQPCLFYDRDGVINQSPGPGYVLNTDAFHLNDGIVDALKVGREKNYFQVLITSQKGVGKGLMSQSDLDQIHQQMQSELAEAGVAFDAIYAYTGPDSPHQPKPDPEMILTAAKEFPINLSRSWMIGDADRDIEMGQQAGIQVTIRIKGDKSISIKANHTVNSITNLTEKLRKVL